MDELITFSETISLGSTLFEIVIILFGPLYAKSFIGQ